MITASKYKIIVDFINNAQDRGEDIVSPLDNMLTTLSNSEIIEESNDRQRLEAQINYTKDVLSSHHYSYTRDMTNFVYTLQTYIDSNYSSVNDFLSDAGIQVLPVFADISEIVGYPIDDSNIESVS